MERKSGEKPKKVDFDSLPFDEYVLYLERADMLISKGYITDKTSLQLARELYDAKWRVVSS